jgi:hypothetical protein
MQGNRVDSRHLMVGSQTSNLTPDLSFDQDLCFKCPNGRCEPILDIYVLIPFQWYKKLFKPICFSPYNRAMKIRESIGTPTPNMGVHLRMWGFIPSLSSALPGACNVPPGVPSWLATLQNLALVTSPRLGLQHLDFVWIQYSYKVQLLYETWVSIKHEFYLLNDVF